METKINEKYLAIRGKIAIAEELNLDDDVTVTVCVQEISDKSLNDGTVDRTYRAVLFAPDEFDGKDITKQPGKMTLSQEQRWELYCGWKEKTDQSIPFEKFYQSYMRRKIDEIREKRKLAD